MDPLTCTFYVAGVKYRPDWRVVLTDLAKRDPSRPLGTYPVSLVGEPSNQHDRNAVKVLAGGVHIGYVPKPVNVDVWARRDAGWRPSASFVAVDGDAQTHEMFKVMITFTKPDPTV